MSETSGGVIEISDIESVMEKLLKRGGRPVLLEGVDIPYDCAAAADGLLPLFLIVGDALWREVQGDGLGVRTERDDGALLGYRLADIRAGSFAGIMLPTMEALAQATGPKGIIVEDLVRVWEESNERRAADIREGNKLE